MASPMPPDAPVTRAFLPVRSNISVFLSGFASPVDVSTVTYVHDEDHEPLVLNVAEDTVVADAVCPKVASDPFRGLPA